MNLAAWHWLCLAFMCLGAAIAPAQNFAVTGTLIAGGGGTSTNATTAVSGTLGQPNAGPKMNGGGFGLESGFWSLAIAVQSPGAPFLSVSMSGGSVILSWPNTAAGYVLEQTGAVAVPESWSPTLQNYTVNGGTVSVTVPAPPGHQFFRLRRP